MRSNSRISFYYSLAETNSLKKAFNECVQENRRIKSDCMFTKTHLHINDDKECADGNDGTIRPVNLLYPVHRKERMLAIDLGNTYLKLCMYNMKDRNISKHTNVLKVKIPRDDSMRHVSVFDWLAGHVYNYLSDRDMHTDRASDISRYVDECENSSDIIPAGSVIPAGMSVPYPVRYHSQTEVYFREMDSHFPFKPINIDNEEIVRSATASFRRHGLNIHVRTVLNDTTATLAGAVSNNHTFYVGVVLGRTINISFNDSVLYDNYVVNTEASLFDSEHLKKNVYDKKMEEEIGENACYRPLECMVGGHRQARLFNMAIRDQFDKDGYTYDEMMRILDTHTWHSRYTSTHTDRYINGHIDRYINGFSRIHVNSTAGNADRPTIDMFDRPSAVRMSVNTISTPINTNASGSTEEYYIILSIKKRCMRILSALILGIAEAQAVKTRMKIVLNGSTFDHDQDRRIFIDEMKRLCSDSSTHDFSDITFESTYDATLRGIARVLLCM